MTLVQELVKELAGLVIFNFYCFLVNFIIVIIIIIIIIIIIREPFVT